MNLGSSFELRTTQESYRGEFGNIHRGTDGYDSLIRSTELKPQMGDDFPAVFRQMKRNGADTLVIGVFDSAACAIDQVRLMFGAVKIVTLAGDPGGH